MKEVNVKVFSVGVIANNAYLVYGEGADAAVIDAAGGFDEIQAEAARLKKHVTGVLLTHGHWDHMVDCRLWQAAGAKVYILAEDAGMLTGEASLASFFRQNVTPATADVLLADGDKVTVGDLCFEVIATPGHSAGGAVFKIADKLFTGDTLFRGCFGRYDLPGGDLQTLAKSIKKLFDLPGDYSVYPGHEELTTLDDERNNNPIVRVIGGLK